MVEAAHLTISGLAPHKIPHLSNLGRLRSRISVVAKNAYLDAKYDEISSYHLDGIEDDDKKERLKKELMESTEVRRDLLDVIDVPDLTEDERQARMKRPPKDMARELIECIEAVENESTDDFVYDTYPQVLAKLKEFLTRDGVTNKMMCKVLGGISPPTLTKFLSGEYMRNLGDETYKAAYVFFEKLRILEKEDKSEERFEE